MSANLPQGWAWAAFEDVAEIALDLVDPTPFPDAWHLAPNHIESKTGKLIERSSISKDKVFSAKHRFRAGQIVYSKIRPYLAKALMAHAGGLCSADMYPINPKVNGRYLLRWMLSSEFTQAASDNQGRTVLPKINKNALSRLPVPVPPLAEQDRIIEKVETLFTRSARVRDELAHVPKLIERYRQAVLEAAFRGDLTVDWRAAHSVDDARQHLDAVLAKRRVRWQAAQTTSQRRAYPEPEKADYFPEIALPTGWTWASVDQLTTEMKYGTSAKTNDHASGIPVLRMGNIVRGELQVENLKYLPADHEDFPTLLLHDGDILFNRTNSPELVGKTAVFKGQLPRASFASYLIRLKAVGILPSLLSAYINSPYGRSWVASVVSQQVGQANVNGTKLSRLAVPLIPGEEQAILDQRISAMMGAIDAMEAEMTRAAGLVDRLNNSILDKAFSGELVPQDPNDEPASKLLERIKAAWTGASPSRRGRRPKVLA